MNFTGSKLELAWAAGFFDGEGHASTARGGYPQIMLSQRHREPLDRFRDAVGAGRIYETQLRGTPLYHYSSHSTKSALRVIALLGPYVSLIKAAQFDRVLREYEEMRQLVSVRGSVEHHAKMSAAAKRRVRTPESEAKRKAAIRAYWERKRSEQCA